MADNVELNRGRNTLEIRLRESHQDDKSNIRFYADAFVFQKGGFRPNFQYAPDDGGWRDSKAKVAAQQTFTLPADRAREPRVEIVLDGAWQYAPYDERIALEENRTDFADEYPDATGASRYGYQVPNNRNQQHPDHKFAHRYLLRTQVDVPAAYDSSSYFLRFEALSLINTLFVNGERRRIRYSLRPVAGRNQQAPARRPEQ